MATEVSDTFEIIIGGAPPPYTITVTGPGISPVLADMPDTTKWLTDDLRRILSDMAAETSPARKEDIQTVGEALYKALFSHDIELAFTEALGNVTDRKLRLRLLIEPPELAALPWETMHDGKDWLVMRSESPLVRRFRAIGGQPPNSLTVQPPLRILFVGASPKGRVGIELLDAEKQLVDTSAELQRQQKARLYRMINPTLDELKKELAQDYHILLFLGHGSAADPARINNPSACIYLDGASDADLEDHPFIRNEQEQRGERKEPTEANPVSAEMLAKTLEGKPTQMVFLSACYTAAASDKERSFESFAQVLAHQVPAIVAMQYFIGADKGAQLAASFLRSLGALRPADVALVEARSDLVDTPDLVTRDYFSPVMYLQYPDLDGIGGSFPVNFLSDRPVLPNPPSPHDAITKYAIAAGVALLAILMLVVVYFTFRPQATPTPPAIGINANPTSEVNRKIWERNWQQINEPLPFYGDSSGIRATNRQRLLGILRNLELDSEPDIATLAKQVIQLVEEAQVNEGQSFYDMVYSSEIDEAFLQLKRKVRNRAIDYDVNTDPLDTASKKCSITGVDSLNLRQNPGTAYTSLGTVSRGQEVRLLAYSPYAIYKDDGKISRPWVKVEVGILQGWVNWQYLECPSTVDMEGLPHVTPLPITSTIVAPEGANTPEVPLSHLRISGTVVITNVEPSLLGMGVSPVSRTYEVDELLSFDAAKPADYYHFRECVGKENGDKVVATIEIPVEFNTRLLRLETMAGNARYYEGTFIQGCNLGKDNLREEAPITFSIASGQAHAVQKYLGNSQNIVRINLSFNLTTP